MEDVKTDSNDQAKELRELLQEVNNHNVEEKKPGFDNEQNLIMNDEALNQEEYDEKTMDVLNLPPRKEVHSQKKNRTHVKLSRPFIRLIIVVVLLLTVIGMLLFYGDLVLTI
ncbi:hypothetical protein [Paucisalibacillus globulus]|uniref:hypothetical protein n=1 Tax=Paucisalibacillus globulus TaxID=351095 RepID=UPI000420840F|nr:hypothetical protein [Paucisalibacillus globulus]